MVYQSEYTTYVLNKITEDTYTCEVGETATVDYTDNALDTVHDTIPSTSVTTTIIGNKIQHIIDINTGVAIGDTLTANLLKVGTSAANKVKYTAVNKDVDNVIQDIMTFELLVQ
jgi:hypothetical protein